jgi:hypothetical protein
VAIKHDLYKTISNIDIYIKFKLVKVKVSIVFLGTIGFSLPKGDIIYGMVLRISKDTWKWIKERK